MPTLILTYHSIDAGGSVISLSRETFTEHLSCLHERGYQALTVRELCGFRRRGENLPPRTVVFTFDDGYGNLSDHAVPLLRRFGFRATVFVVSDYAGRLNNWPGQTKGIPRLPLLGWNELRDLAEIGFEIASHSRTHPVLPNLSKPDLDNEVLTSKKLIEDKIGEPVDTFAYPYGLFNAQVALAVSAPYQGACTTEMRPVSAVSKDFLLPRIDTYYLQDPWIFQRLDTNLGRSYVYLRHLGRRSRAFLHQVKAASSQSGPKAAPRSSLSVTPQRNYDDISR